MTAQELLLKQIRKQLSENQSINDEIASVLNISYDASHRRVSGKSKFSIDETVQLTKHFNISMDNLFFQTEKIIVEKIVPLSNAFRSAGSLIVHAPSYQVALKYPDFLPKMTDQEIWGNLQPKHQWPPKEFMSCSGQFSSRMRPEQSSPNKKFNDIIENWAIAPEMEPQKGDVVIRTGEELHHLLEQRKILYLFYVGFATNICMLNRDYGMKLMSKRGFEIILARDATTGVEYAHTLATLGQTAAAITTEESNIGYSITTSELLEAFEKAKA